MNYQCECMYCGHRWLEYFYGELRTRPRCPHCTDPQVKVTKIEKTDVFGYDYE